jgi:8-oxo-dGTP pyrophosphatase MutT (NUDIX family)
MSSGDDRAEIPAWCHPLRELLPHVRPEAVFGRPLGSPAQGRPSAVLILLADLGADAPAAPPEVPPAGVVLLQRAATLRNHAGQPAFPGGAAEPNDADLTATALRETQEEVGIAQDEVTLLGALPALFLPPSGFTVTPIVAWWRRPRPLAPVDLGEVASVALVPIAELADPVNRTQVRHSSGFTAPGFAVRGMLVWGFTAGLLSFLLDLVGWSRPWDETRLRDLPS